MKLVKYILESKGGDIWHIAPDESVLNAIKMMAERQIGALFVLEHEKLAGIVSERDYARKVILQGKSSKETPVKEIMTAEVVCAEPLYTVEQCMEIMTEKHIRHLPVLGAGGEVVGVLSIGDLVKAIIAEQQFTIEQLEHYIAG